MSARWLSYSTVGALLAVGVIVGVIAATAGQDDGDESPYAPPRGAPGIDCTETAQPGEDPAAFVASLEAGETACFPAGSYASDDDIVLDEPDVRLTSAPGETATLAGRIWVQAEADGAVIENLVLDGENDSGLPSPTVHADRVEFRGNEVTNDHTGICFLLGDDNYDDADDVLIEGNRIHDCGRLPATNHDHGIYVAQSTGTVIRDNLIYGNADRGVQLFPDADETLVTGNVIDGNGQGVLFAGGEDIASNNNVVEHNLITNSVLRYNVESSWAGPVGTGNLVRENCIRGGARDDGNGGIQRPEVGFRAVDNLIAEPGYTDREAGDFSLGDDSRCARL